MLYFCVGVVRLFAMLTDAVMECTSERCVCWFYVFMALG